HAGMRAWAVSVRRNFDAGQAHHGWVAWALAAIVPALLAAGIYWLLDHFVGWPVAMLWNVAILYVTLGFRQFSHHFTRIRDALEAADEFTAREELAQWQQVDTTEVPRSQVVRHVNSCFFTMVAVDDDKKPALVPPLEPPGDEEKRRWQAAIIRKELRKDMAERFAQIRV
ncbi:MAG: hypothetical protein RR376_28940, partial [Janthinobacterium sp.]